MADHYVRNEEIHRLQLYEGACISQVLRDIGFDVQTLGSYGDYPLPEHVLGFLAVKS